MTDTIKNLMLRTALFSGLGLFAYFLLDNFTGFSQGSVRLLASMWIYLFFVVMFNVLGHLIIRMSSWLNNQYLLNSRRKWKIAAAYLAIILLMLGVNYALFVAAKLIMGATYPYTFPNGGLRILILVWLVSLVVLGLLSANKSMQDTLRLQRRAAALQEENNAARYAALQNQLNPHFLFNSLNTLVAEIEYDPRQAVTFTRRLSDVYRYVLQCQNKRMVTIAEELQFAESYLYLHEVRLGGCISLKVEVPDEERESLVPSLTLQLLVENVFKHNTITADRPMEVGIATVGGWLVVSNTFNPRKHCESTGVGLKNLSARCRMTLGQEIQVAKSEGLFTVKIPLLYE